jgi:hypothetical protein
MQPKRHIGKLINTDQRLVVVFMQIPGREDHALVVGTDALPPRFEQALMTIVESAEAQTMQDLGQVLGRRMMPDSTMTVLQALHNAGMLNAVPVDRVIMLPFPSRPFPLRQVLESMGKVVPGGVNPSIFDAPTLTEAALPTAAETGVEDIAEAALPDALTQRFNPHTANQQAAATEQHVGVAQSLLIEAADLEAVAKAKREQAYQYAPSLRPAPRVQAPAPVAAAEVVAETATKRRAAPKRTAAKQAKG